MLQRRIVVKPRIGSSQQFQHSNRKSLHKSFSTKNQLVHVEQKQRSQSVNIQKSDIPVQKKRQPSVCYHVDLKFLENITAQDESVKELIKELGISEVQIDLNTLIKQNQDYFRHLSKNCACFKCSCCNCKCDYAQNYKVILPSGYRTSYNRDFKKYKQNYHTTPLDQKVYEQNTKKPENLEQLLTINKKSYQKHPTILKQQKPLFRLSEKQFYSNTMYKNSYLDWKTQDPNWIFKQPQHHSTHKEMPMMLNTSYQKDYRVDTMPTQYDAEEVKKIQTHQTYTKIVPQRFNTTYSDDFIFQENCNKRIVREQEIYTPTQGCGYQTVNQQEFKSWSIDNCQGRNMKKILKQKNLGKLLY